jgi:hypothetical protein
MLDGYRLRVLFLSLVMLLLTSEIVRCPSSEPSPNLRSRLFWMVLIVVDDLTEGYEKPDLENSHSSVIMQYLTKRCLEFEVKFGKYPGRYG